MAYQLIRNGGYPPPKALQFGYQTDGHGLLWVAVAHTQHGDIPGKAQGNTCWYSYGGKEEMTQNFSWVTSDAIDWALHKNDGRRVPGPGALMIGFQNDGAGQHHAVIAETPHGRIPGKAKNGTCWYSHAGKEHATKDFLWICRHCDKP